MRAPEEQQLALECLRLALASEPSRAVELAREFYAFVRDDDSAAKLAKVREAVT